MTPCIMIWLLFVYVFELAYILGPLDAAESPLLDAYQFIVIVSS